MEIGVKIRCDLMTIIERMDKPEDTFRKISHSYLPDIVHDYYELPGKYIGTITNEFPNADKKIKKTDGSYIVDLEEDAEIYGSFYPDVDSRQMIINIEDESSVIRKKTLAKTFEYSINMNYAFHLPVYTVLTTPKPLDKCERHYISGNMISVPKIISFQDFDGKEKLKNYEEKVKKDKHFSYTEGYDLVNIPKMFEKNNAEVLEKVCTIFSKIKIDDLEIKFRLAKCLECMIHKYAETIEDINRLEETIKMYEIVNEREKFLKGIRREGEAEGIAIGEAKGEAKGIAIGEAIGEAKGEAKGRLEMAREIAKKIGADEISKISGIDKKYLI